MRKSKVFSFGVVAFILAGCAVSPESVVDLGLKAAKAFVKFDNLIPDAAKPKAAEIVENHFKTNRSDYINQAKEHCSQDDLKILEQRYSCMDNAKDSAAFNKCDESHKLGDGKCNDLAKKIVKDTKKAVKTGL